MCGLYYLLAFFCSMEPRNTSHAKTALEGKLVVPSLTGVICLCFSQKLRNQRPDLMKRSVVALIRLFRL